jgi:hypothetical protein
MFLLLISLRAHASEGASLQVLHLVAKDGRFEPTVLMANAGEKFAIEVKNEGPETEEFESTELNREKRVGVGKTILVYIGPLASGEYPFFGDEHPMTANGKLIVK